MLFRSGRKYYRPRRFISLQQFCIQRIPRRKFPPSDAWLRYVRSMPSIPQRYIVVLQSPVPPGRDAMPLGQTSPAAAGRGVLGDKDRMPAHRGLPPVIGNNGRSEACAHEICGMTPDSLHAFSLDIGDIFRFQTKSSAELGCRQPGEQRIEGFCRMGIFNHFSPQIKSATKIRTVNAFLSVPAGIFARGIPGTVSAMPIRRLPAATKFPSSDKRLSADGYTSDTYFWRSPSVRPYLKDNALQKRTFRKRSFLSGISFPSLHIRL